jgi:hypothetical protein
MRIAEENWKVLALLFPPGWQQAWRSRVLYSIRLPSLVCDFFELTATIGDAQNNLNNRIRLVFQSQPQSLFRVLRIDVLVAFGQTGSLQIARRLIIVHDQDVVHAHLDLKQLAPPIGNICPWSATPREFSLVAG